MGQTVIYRNLIIETETPPSTSETIKQLEAALGVQLPDDYKKFLSHCNGGDMDYQINVQLPDGSSEFIGFSVLYSVSEGEWETNPFELQQARAQSEFPSAGVLPIAIDGGGSILYLDLRDGYKVVAFVHGLPAWTGLREEDSLIRVASSFDDYLSKLVICDEIAQHHIEHFEITPESVANTIQWLDSGNRDWRSKFRTVWNERVPDAKV
jgi:cell wall assembly regulator SMI1